MFEELYDQAVAITEELCEKAGLKKGQILVVELHSTSRQHLPQI